MLHLGPLVVAISVGRQGHPSNHLSRCSSLSVVVGGVRRRGTDDRRHHHQPQRNMLDHDNGNPPIDALSRERGDERSGLGYLWWDTLYEVSYCSSLTAYWCFIMGPREFPSDQVWIVHVTTHHRDRTAMSYSPIIMIYHNAIYMFSSLPHQ